MESENFVVSFISFQSRQMKQQLWLYSVKIGAIFFMVLDKIVAPIFWVLSWKRSKKIPPVEHKIFEISAKNLAKMIRKKEINSEEVVRRYINRINKVNPILNAVVQDRFVEAIHEACTVDEWLRQTSLSIDEIERGYPLLGVPITIKESCKVKGMSFCVGTNVRKGMIADEDGEVVKRIKSSGAIPLLVSNTPEICFGIESDNFVTGRCNNPYNTNYTCGGSSGGEGALLGSACSVIGIGSDLAGSIRVPSLFNGIFGHKPTANLVPNRDHYPIIHDEDFYEYLVLGPMCRYSEDLRLVLNVMTNHPINLNEKVDMKKVTVYHTEDTGNLFFVNNVNQDVRDAIKKCADHLKHHCKAKLNNSKIIDLEKCFDMGLSLFFGVKNKPDLLLDQVNPPKRYNIVSEFIKLQFKRSTLNYNSLAYDFLTNTHSFLTVKDNDYYRDMLDHLKTNLMNTLGQYGVILFPTMPGPTFQHGYSPLKCAGVVYSMIFNILGFPATHVPLGLNKQGLPIGVQVIASPHRDAVCLSVAEELEVRFGGWVAPF
ncbi:fatty-acid amide hydrolase 2-like [Onthophagus taurus]|uniref:fatty-acid amide hydrolase 2-like n=1 Tax=Onthophagus taurus TaxID=166361 RepID=UPI000C20BB6C|nr:fatty-acid amide hydrolase 2-like isoform X1 [Onthophagus taurus]XP_022908984.1 fatty-acid amide hydrolase 2-like isoform X2 [Onthophagus taurus]